MILMSLFDFLIEPVWMGIMALYIIDFSGFQTKAAAAKQMPL